MDLLGAGEPPEAELVAHDWRGLGLARQLLVIAGPWLAVAAIAVALLGPAHAARSFASAIDQLVFTLDPTPLMRRYFAVVATSPLPVAVGILFAKLAVLHLLPFGGLAGGQILNLLAGGGRREGAPKPVQIWLMGTVLFVMLYITGRFAYALIRAL